MRLMGGPVYPGGTYSLDLDFPQQAAVGMAWRAGERITLAADLKWINWSDTMGELKVVGPDGYDFAMDPGWDDQLVYALGLDLLITEQLNLRFGFNYAESPIDENNAANNLILPGIVEDHYTFGLEYRFDHWDLAFHYMYAPENLVRAKTMFPGTVISLEEQSVGINLGYRWD